MALVGPFFVDWTSYRADFEREASRILGRDVSVNGTASARLLPFPSVSFTDVTVSGSSDGAPSMTVDTFSMDAELAPFLSGEILIFDMRLERPVVTVAIDDRGGFDWAERSDNGIGARQITLENVTVEDGEVRILHALSGREHRLTGFDARVSAQTLAGPWRIDGVGSLDGVAATFGLSTGTLDNGALRVRLRASPVGSPFHLETDGTATIADGKASYSGQFGAELVEALPEDQSPAPVAAHRLIGEFEIDHDALDIAAFNYQTGPIEDPYIANGRASVDFGAEPRFSVQADGAQLRLDSEAAEVEEAGTASLETRLASIESFLLALPKPVIPGTVEINLPALVAGDTTIRDLQLKAEPADGGWQVERLQALLPGRSTIEANGRLDVAEGLAFKGELLLAVNQPSGFATWLARDVDDTIRNLPPGGFSANVALSRSRQSFRDLELALGGAVFRGEIDSATPADLRPSLSIVLDGDRLDFPAMRAFASLFVDDRGLTRLDQRDVDIDLKAGPVEFDGLSAGSLDTAVRLRDGQIEIDRLALTDLAGSNISATGSLHGLGAEPAGHVDASIIAVDLAPLITELSGRFPGNAILPGLARRAELYPGLFEDSEIDLIASAVADDGGALSVNGVAGGSQFAVTLTAPRTDRPIADLPIALNATIRNDEPAALYGLAGLPGLPLGFVGPAEITARIDGELARGATASLALRADDLTSIFEGEARLDGGAPSLSGQIDVDGSDLSGWLATAGVSVPGMTAGLPLDLEADLDIGQGLAIVSNLAGTALDQSVKGDLNIERRDGRSHLSGALAIEAVDLDWLAAMTLGERAVNDGSTAFASAPSGIFSADVDLSAGAATIGSLRMDDLRTGMRFGSEGLRLNDLQAGLYGGVISGFAELANNAGTGLLSTQLKLDGASLAQALNQPALDGEFDLSAVLTSNGKTIDAMASALSGSASVALPRVAISGLNPDALPALLAEADRVGRDIDEAATAQFAPRIIGEGVFEAAVGDIALSVAGGQLRAPPIVVDGEAATLTANLRADLPAGTVAIDALVAYDPGDDQLVGSAPSVSILVEGAPAAPEIRFDTLPLAQFLTQRALEIEQARVEDMQAGLLEGQRLRRENRYFAALEDQRQRAAEEQRREEARRAADAARRAAEEEAQRVAEESARREAEEAARQVEEDEDAQFRLDVERFLETDDAFETEPLPAPSATPAPAEIFRPENLTIEGLLGGDGGLTGQP